MHGLEDLLAFSLGVMTVSVVQYFSRRNDNQRERDEAVIRVEIAEASNAELRGALVRVEAVTRPNRGEVVSPLKPDRAG